MQTSLAGSISRSGCSSGRCHIYSCHCWHFGQYPLSPPSPVKNQTGRGLCLATARKPQSVTAHRAPSCQSAPPSASASMWAKESTASILPARHRSGWPSPNSQITPPQCSSASPCSSAGRSGGGNTSFRDPGGRPDARTSGITTSGGTQSLYGHRTAALAVLAVLSFVPAAAASGFLGCFTAGNAPVACTDPSAVVCADLDYPNGDSPSCTSLGFTVSPNDTQYCVDMACSQSPVQVPELEDYAAAMFLVAALGIGWRVRQRHAA